MWSHKERERPSLWPPSWFCMSNSILKLKTIVLMIWCFNPTSGSVDALVYIPKFHSGDVWLLSDRLIALLLKHNFFLEIIYCLMLDLYNWMLKNVITIRIAIIPSCSFFHIVISYDNIQHVIIMNLDLGRSHTRGNLRERHWVGWIALVQMSKWLPHRNHGEWQQWLFRFGFCFGFRVRIYLALK